MEKPSLPPPTSPPAPRSPSPKPRLTICPYCGSQTRSDSACECCRGKFDPLSRQATQNAMGPWFIRDEANPYRPGCSYATLVGLIERGSITADTVIRGPSSKQFWTLARWCPGVAHRLGVCHSCQQLANPAETDCGHCGASFRVSGDRQGLGLGEVRPLPGQQSPAGKEIDPRPTALTAQKSATQEPVTQGPVTQEPAMQDFVQASRGSGGGAAEADPGVDPRLLRLERELRRSRRWRTGWAVGFLLVVLAVAGVFVVRGLDLDAGPVGKWLHAREQGAANAGDGGGEVGDGEGVGGGSTAGATPITPITTPDLSAGDDGAATVERAEPELPAQSAEPAPDGMAPPSVPPSVPPSTASRGRLDLLALLRRLR